MFGPVSLAPFASVRRRFMPSTVDVGALLEAVSEAEPVRADALPPAAMVAHALAALVARAPDFALERVTVAVRDFAHADLRATVAGTIEPVGINQARAALRVSQRGTHVLDVAANGTLGHIEEPKLETSVMPEALSHFAHALHEDEDRYAGVSSWPVELVVALAAAGVEAEEQDGLARLLRLTVELVREAPIGERLRFAIDGVKPISGDHARVVFRVITSAPRRPGLGYSPTLVARGDAIIASALARSAAMTLRRVA